MKIISFLTLATLLSFASCSHHQKSCCAKKAHVTCSKEKCDKPCCKNEMKCADGSCAKEKAECKDGSCHKKTEAAPKKKAAN